MKLKYKYQLGSSSDNIFSKANVSDENPFVDRYVNLLNNLKPTKHTWGIVLEKNKMYKFVEEKQITEDDYNFLIRIMFPEDLDDDEDDLESKDYFKTEKDNEYADELSTESWLGDAVRSETEYTFLVFEGINKTKK